MKKESAISIGEVRFCAYSADQKKKVRKDIRKLTFDSRNDFFYTATFAGMAARVELVNERSKSEHPSGVRHKMNMTLIDVTERTEIASHQANVRIIRDKHTEFFYADFPLSSTQFHSQHTYRLVVYDETQYTMIGGHVFHLFDEEDIALLDKYSHEAAEARPNKQTLTLFNFSDEDDFDAALERFLACDTEPEDDNNNKPLLSSLDNLTGLESVKNKLRTYERMIRFNMMRSDIGLPVTSTPLHAMFLGSPGTGKTTVAKLMGEMLHRAGVLSKGHVVVYERSTLLGQHYSSEAENTRKAIKEAQGGILLIDEAYQLYQPNDDRDPGKFVIETLLTALSDEKNRNWMLILAGYPDEMKRMFELNPGFKSRIPDSNIYQFENFTEQELMEIARNYLSQLKYSLTPEASIALSNRLKTDYSHREKNFGNARHIVNIIQTEILPAMAVRVTDIGEKTEQALTEIQPTDIPAAPQYKTSSSRPRIGYII